MTAEAITVRAMTLPTEPLRAEHRELLPEIERLRSAADLVGNAPADELAPNVASAHMFLVGHLIPHATAEDEVLYPAVEEAMGAPGATDSMRRDHVEVMRLTDELGELGSAIGQSPPVEVELDLRRVLYGLYGIVKLHFAKEEEIYLPVLDGRLDEARARQLFERMERAAARAKRGTHD